MRFVWACERFIWIWLDHGSRYSHICFISYICLFTDGKITHVEVTELYKGNTEKYMKRKRHNKDKHEIVRNMAWDVLLGIQCLYDKTEGPVIRVGDIHRQNVFTNTVCLLSVISLLSG